MRKAPEAALLAVLAAAARASAGGRIDAIPEIGPHYRIVTIEKSVHPQNQLIAYTRLDALCRFAPDAARANRPVFDYYWLMDRSRYKRVNPLIERGIRGRFQVQDAPARPDDRSFEVRLNELDEVQNDLGASPRLKVRAAREAGGCRVDALITLGPSDRNAVLRLDGIFSEAVMTGLFTATVKSIALKGTDVRSGKPVVRVYRAK
jgi:hypothetical protein